MGLNTNLAALTGTSLALGGATIGSNALAVTGTILSSGNITASGSSQLIAGGDVYGGTGLGITSKFYISSPVDGTLALKNWAASITTNITLPVSATLQLGAANAASPVAQTFQAQGSRSGTDTNVAGATLTIQPGAGTGNAVPGALILKSYVAVASGTGAQTATTSITVSTGGATIGVGGLTFPAADPLIAGRWWDNAGTLTKSAG